jgi:hypothetical protein
MKRAWLILLLGVVLAWGTVGCGDDSAEEGDTEANNHAHDEDAGEDAHDEDAGEDASPDEDVAESDLPEEDADNNDNNPNNPDNNVNNPDNNANNPDNNGGLEVACPVEGCGGDVVGTWNWESWCRTIAPEDLLIPECPEAVVEQEIVPQGTLSFQEDGTYEVAAVYEIQSALLMPLSCLGGAGCEALVASLNEQEEAFLWTCEAEGEACACDRLQELDGSQTGTYEAQDGILTTYPANEEEARPLVYCVEGDTLQARDQGAQVTDPTFFLTRAQ